MGTHDLPVSRSCSRVDREDLHDSWILHVQSCEHTKPCSLSIPGKTRVTTSTIFSVRRRVAAQRSPHC